MNIVWTILGIVAALALLVVLISYLCFLKAFHNSNKWKHIQKEFDLPEGKIYEPHWEKMKAWMTENRKKPFTQVSIRSFDGLTLQAKYYECTPESPVELMFHGYRGTAERDLCGGVQRAFALGHSVLIVDQRASTNSDGNVISFGINESKDCLAWVDFAANWFGDNRKIILTGISMGAATVMMVSDQDLPKNVVGILADCGYSSPKAIIQKVIRDLKLPPKLAYPFVKLGARLFGGFNLEERSPVEALKHAKVPVIFFHGGDDDFVPCSMSQENYEACASHKRLVIIPGAGHGLCCLIDTKTYMEELKDFFGPLLN